MRLKKEEPRSGKEKSKIAYTFSDLDIDLVKGKFLPIVAFFVRGTSFVLSENVCTTHGLAKGTKGIF